MSPPRAIARQPKRRPQPGLAGGALRCGRVWNGRRRSVSDRDGNVIAHLWAFIPPRLLSRRRLPGWAGVARVWRWRGAIRRRLLRCGVRVLNGGNSALVHTGCVPLYQNVRRARMPSCAARTLQGVASHPRFRGSLASVPDFFSVCPEEIGASSPASGPPEGRGRLRWRMAPRLMTPAVFAAPAR